MNAEQNVDAHEIGKFEALAERWWDPDGEFKPLHQLNPLRANFIDSHSPVAGQRLLDVGCGGGILTESMARRGAVTSGIDMGEAPLQVARRHALEGGLEIDYRQCTAEELAATEAGQYDIVCCLEMLEHVPDPAAVIRACAALTRPGGTLYFSTINRSPKAFLLAIVGAEHLLRLLPAGTHEYEKFIRPSELAAWLRQAGLTLGEMSGLHYNPLTGQFRLAPRDVSVNYLLRADKP
jgi:2-polyprenyl-6-hydroxyphenyl methylase / 3-demethylubiquinone-9 3-methyltransferase